MTLEAELAADTKRVRCQLCLLLDDMTKESRDLWVSALRRPGAIVGNESVSRRILRDFNVSLSTSIIKNHRRHA